MMFIRYVKYWIPLVLWMSVIFWMSTEAFSAQNTSLIIEPVIRHLIPSISQERVNTIHGAVRKLAHLTEYFILGMLLFRAFRSGSKELRMRRWAFWSIFFVVLCATADEFHQSFVSTRTASLLDIGLDALGGILAQGVSALWFFSRQ